MPTIIDQLEYFQPLPTSEKLTHLAEMRPYDREQFLKLIFTTCKYSPYNIGTCRPAKLNHYKLHASSTTSPYISVAYFLTLLKAIKCFGFTKSINVHLCSDLTFEDLNRFFEVFNKPFFPTHADYTQALQLLSTATTVPEIPQHYSLVGANKFRTIFYLDSWADTEFKVTHNSKLLRTLREHIKNNYVLTTPTVRKEYKIRALYFNRVTDHTTLRVFIVADKIIDIYHDKPKRS